MCILVKWFFRFYKLSLSQEMFACLLVKKKWHSCNTCVGATTESGPLWITHFYMCQNLLKNEAYHNRYCCDSIRCKYIALYSVSSSICLEWEIRILAYKKIFQQSTWTISVYMCLLGRMLSEGFWTWYSLLVIALKGHFPLHLVN